MINRKEISKLHMGNERIHEFVLSYLYEKYPQEISLQEFIDYISNQRKELENPLLDVTSKMLYESKEIQYIDSSKTSVRLTDIGIKNYLGESRQIRMGEL